MLARIRYIGVLDSVIMLASGFRSSRLLTLSPVKALLLCYDIINAKDGFDLPVAKGHFDLVSVNAFQTNTYSTCFGRSNKFRAHLFNELPRQVVLKLCSHGCVPSIAPA
jgi:hypothetical protein